MANTTVTKVGQMLLANVTAGIEAGKQKVSDSSGFSEVMNNAKDTTAKISPAADDGAKASRTVVETPKSKEIKAGEQVRKDPTANEKDMEELTEEVAEAVSTIVNKIKEVLGVSDEEVETAMENLGITAASLIDPLSVRDLCMEITGTPDSISLLTNADLYNNLKEIMQTAEDAVSQIAAQFDLKPDQTENIFKDESFKDAVEDVLSILQNRSKADELQPNEAVTVPTGAVDDQMPIQDTDVENGAGVTAAAEKQNTDTDVTVNTDAKAPTVTVEVNREADAGPAAAEAPTAEDALARQSVGATETFTATAKSEASNLKGNDEGFEHASRFAETEAIGTTTQQTTVVTTEVNNLGEVVETVTRYTDADAESIMSQVTQSIRVNYTADTTSMEMQLHPASLGTVNMHVALNNGMVTAHILVENEAVKSALESQLLTLQQTFDEQGIKSKRLKSRLQITILTGTRDPTTRTVPREETGAVQERSETDAVSILTILMKAISKSLMKRKSSQPT